MSALSSSSVASAPAPRECCMIVDDREHDLIERFKAEGVAHEVKRLPLGDIIIEQNGTTCIIERKRTDDFASSIRDGRWREQKTRLRESGAIVVYIIEGSLYGQRVPVTTLSSALWNTRLRDRMWVVQTRGIEDTSLHLQTLRKKVGKDIRTPGSTVTLLSKRKRKEDNVFLLMLMSIPRVSERVAKTITASWPTLTKLQAQLNTNTQTVSDLKITEKRKIGPAITKHLVTQLL